MTPKAYNKYNKWRGKGKRNPASTKNQTVWSQMILNECVNKAALSFHQTSEWTLSCCCCWPLTSCSDVKLALQPPGLSGRHEARLKENDRWHERGKTEMTRKVFASFTLVSWAFGSFLLLAWRVDIQSLAVRLSHGATHSKGKSLLYKEATTRPNKSLYLSTLHTCDGEYQSGKTGKLNLCEQ